MFIFVLSWASGLKIENFFDVEMGKIVIATAAELGILTTIENPVIKWSPIGEIDRTRLQDTVEAAFGETLKNNYFAEMSRQGAVVCYEGGYRAVGVVIPDLYHIVTLARHPLYRGQHLGEKVLMEILAKLGKFNLRSKPERDGANALYKETADDNVQITSVDQVKYNAYWKNHLPFEVAIALAYMSSQPSHFKR